MPQTIKSRRWDATLAVIGVVLSGVLSLFLALRSYPVIYTAITGSGILVGMGYLRLRKRLASKEKDTTDIIVAPIALASAAVMLAIALITFYQRDNQYVKPLGYYLFTAESIGFCSLFVLTAPAKKVMPAVWIAALIGIAHIWTENALFPGSLLGIDPWIHFRTVTNYLPVAGLYGNPPVTLTTIGACYSLMHLVINWIITIGADYKTASLIIGGSVMASSAILIYLRRRKASYPESRGLAALLIVTSGWVIYSGMWVIPNSLGAPMVLGTSYL